jgi:ArsR family transcriptional regulator, virulence genes transcriptional regulator
MVLAPHRVSRAAGGLWGGIRQRPKGRTLQGTGLADANSYDPRRGAGVTERRSARLLPMKKAKRSHPGRRLTGAEIAAARSQLAAMAPFDETVELLHLVGSATRLKLLYLLASEEGLAVGDLAARVGLAAPSVSQHLAKLRQHGLVAARREAQSLYYRLTDHPFNEALRASFL